MAKKTENRNLPKPKSRGQGRGKRRGRKSATDYLVIGLGNPGSKYKNTRHNVGFLAIDELLARHSPTGLKSGKIIRGQVEVSQVEINSARILLAKPHTFMNLSGLAVKQLLRKFKLKDFSRMIVIHDELDLPPGKVRFKEGGGTAGHKGLGSLRKSLGSSDFSRIRVGIGKPPSSSEGADYVLGEIAEAETLSAISEAADILESLIESA